MSKFTMYLKELLHDDKPHDGTIEYAGAIEYVPVKVTQIQRKAFHSLRPDNLIVSFVGQEEWDAAVAAMAVKLLNKEYKYV